MRWGAGLLVAVSLMVSEWPNDEPRSLAIGPSVFVGKPRETVSIDRVSVYSNRTGIAAQFITTPMAGPEQHSWSVRAWQGDRLMFTVSADGLGQVFLCEETARPCRDDAVNGYAEAEGNVAYVIWPLAATKPLPADVRWTAAVDDVWTDAVEWFPRKP